MKRNMYIISPEIENFLKLCQKVRDNQKILEEQFVTCNNRTCDFQHKIELEGAFDGNWLDTYKEEVENRKLRRQYKDEMEVNAALLEFANSKSYHELTKVLGEVRKIEERHTKRIYYQRCGG